MKELLQYLDKNKEVISEHCIEVTDREDGSFYFTPPDMQDEEMYFYIRGITLDIPKNQWKEFYLHELPKTYI